MNHKDNLKQIVADKAKLFGTTTAKLTTGPMGKAEAEALVRIVAASPAGLTSAGMLEKHLGISQERVRQAERFMQRAARPRLHKNRRI